MAGKSCAIQPRIWGFEGNNGVLNAAEAVEAESWPLCLTFVFKQDWTFLISQGFGFFICHLKYLPLENLKLYIFRCEIHCGAYWVGLAVMACLKQQLWVHGSPQHSCGWQKLFLSNSNDFYGSMNHGTVLHYYSCECYFSTPEDL